jgi:hypothetical protein
VEIGIAGREFGAFLAIDCDVRGKAEDKIQMIRETEIMSIQKKSLVSAIKTTRKANLVKDESSPAASVGSATKTPAKALPRKTMPRQMLRKTMPRKTLRKTTLRQVL